MAARHTSLTMPQASQDERRFPPATTPSPEIASAARSFASRPNSKCRPHRLPSTTPCNCVVFRTRARSVKSANCLIQILNEIDSLPHLRNLNEMAPSAGRGRGQDEADDEGAQGGRKGPANAVSPGEQEGEGPAARRTGRAHRLPPLLCGGGAGWPRCAGGGVAWAGGAASAATAAGLR